MRNLELQIPISAVSPCCRPTIDRDLKFLTINESDEETDEEVLTAAKEDRECLLSNKEQSTHDELASIIARILQQ